MMGASESGVDEEELIRFMLEPASYPHRPEGVRLVQTHASLVFLASPLVYKVKKPVNFGFLDFSTLEKRRHFCGRELELNRRLCPEGYLEVAPVTLNEGRLSLGGAGEVVEYALVMREFEAEGFLDARLERGEATVDDLERVVGVLLPFYQSQIGTPEIAQCGEVGYLRLSTDENFEQTRRFVGVTISEVAFATLEGWTAQFYERNAELFERRVREGWIRDCHGDLHVEHIHLMPEQVRIYDCIEFNERFRFIDVASDVAFLGMDLDYRGRHDLAKWFERRIASALEDADLPKLLDFYKAYRAYVRGKVESLHGESPEADEAEKEQSRERARRYFRLALRYAVVGSEPVLLAVMGRVASGKSSVAAALAAELGWQVISSDRMRKELAGLEAERRSPEAERAELYSAAMTRATYAKVMECGVETMGKDGGCVLDATFSQRSQRDALRQAAAEQGLGCRFLFIEASLGRRCERLRQRDDAAALGSDAREEDQAALDARFEPPSVEETDVATIDADGSTEETLAACLRYHV